MRLFTICGVLAVLMLAGCAETLPEATDGAATEAPDDETPVDAGADAGAAAQDAAGLIGTLNATVLNATIVAGIPFNVTLDYEGDNATDAAGLAWVVTFSNATDATSYNGTGLPTVLAANLTLLGNVTMEAIASDGADNVTFEGLVLQVLAPVAEDLDPCADVVFEPVTISGSFTAAVNGAGFYSSNPFNVPACATSLHAIVTGDTLMVDMMLRLRDASDSEDLKTSDGRADSTEELTYTVETGLASAYDLNVRGFIAGPSNYEGTITFS